MRENRTKLGKITLGVLSSVLIVTAVNTITNLILIATSDYSEYESGFVIGAAIAVIIPVLLFIGFEFVFWNAFRKNMPEKIKWVTIIMMVFSAILILSAIISSSAMNRLKAEMGDDVTMNDTNPVRMLIVGILLLVIGIIFLIEIRQAESEGFKSAWIVVGVLSLMLCVNGAFGSGSKDPAGVITSTLMVICMAVGITLISYWITNQEKFYAVGVSDNKDDLSGILKKDNQSSYTDQLKELKHLLDQGFITEDDYNRKKNEILGFKDE